MPEILGLSGLPAILYRLQAAAEYPNGGEGCLNYFRHQVPVRKAPRTENLLRF
jgi:hypothetical protein